MFDSDIRIRLQQLLRFCVLVFFLFVQTGKTVYAQKHRDVLKNAPSELYADKLDTLKFAERISLRTNMLDWTLLTPNVNIEFDLLPQNWSKWTISVGGRYNGNAKNTFSPYYNYNIKEIRGEVRHYWHTVERGYENRRKWYTGVNNKMEYSGPKLLKPFSRQRLHPRLNRAYYIGAYIAYTNFSIKLGREGKQGTALFGGVSFGFQTPLYGFVNGHSLDFEIGANLGVSALNYDTYRYDRDAHCYPLTGHVDSKIMPMVHELRIALVYRFGRSSVDRYKDRYEIDKDGPTSYRERYISRHDMRDSLQRRKQDVRDSIRTEKIKNKELKQKEKEAKKAQELKEKEIQSSSDKSDKNVVTKEDNKENKKSKKEKTSKDKKEKKNDKDQKSHPEETKNEQNVESSEESKIGVELTPELENEDKEVAVPVVPVPNVVVPDSVEVAPVKTMPAESETTEDLPSENEPVESVPVQDVPAESVPVEAATIEQDNNIPEETPVEEEQKTEEQPTNEKNDEEGGEGE